jgi:hypothetical protein
MNVLEWMIKLSAVIGGILSIYNFWHAKKKEKQEQREKKNRELEEEAEFQLLTELHNSSSGVMKPEAGSIEHKRLERLAERGRVERLLRGEYGVPGVRRW